MSTLFNFKNNGSLFLLNSSPVYIGSCNSDGVLDLLDGSGVDESLLLEAMKSDVMEALQDNCEQWTPAECYMLALNLLDQWQWSGIDQTWI